MIKPRIKTSHPVIVSEKSICIGEIPGYASVIKNPAPWIVELLNLLDGSKTVDMIFQLLQKQGFALSFEEMIAILKKLQDKSFLEEGALQSHNLSAEELERYHRQIIYFSLVEKNGHNGFSYQEKIKNQHIAIFGVGGWGSWMALNLCAAGVGELTLIDGDVIERSNLNRQILFETADIGKSKVKVAATKLKNLNPNVTINIIPKKVTSTETEIETILKSCTFAVLAWTNLSYFKENTVEGQIHNIAAKHHIPVIEIGADPLFVSVGPIFTNDGNSVCFECVKQKVLKDHYSLDDTIRSFQDKRLTDNRKNLNKLLYSYQTAASLSIMSGLATEQLIKYVTGCEKTVLLSQQFKFSLQDYELTKEQFFSSRSCKACNKVENVL